MRSKLEGMIGRKEIEKVSFMKHLSLHKSYPEKADDQGIPGRFDFNDSESMLITFI